MKKTLKALLVIVLVVAIVIGAVAGVTYYRKGNKTVDVYSVSMLNLGYYENTTTSEGVVKITAVVQRTALEYDLLILFADDG